MRNALAVIAAALVFPAHLLGGLNRWTSTGPADRDITALAIAALDPEVIYVATRSGAFFRSDDFGATWMERGSISADRILVDPANPSRLIARSQGRIQRSFDGGASWNPLPLPPVPSPSVISIAASPANFSVLYLGATWFTPPPGTVQQGGLFRSSDGGNTWVESTLRGVGINDIAVDPSNPLIVYTTPFGVPVMTGINGRGVVKSVDGGITWSERLPQFRLTTPLTWVVVDPRNPNDVYAGDIFNFIHKSTNAGATFQRIKLESAIGTVNSLVVETSGSLYAATSRGGVLRSLNSGLDWAPFNCGLPHLTMTQIVVSPDARVLHVGTRWGGVFSYELSVNDLPSTCSDAGVVCLGVGGRFCVRVTWRTPDGRSGFGRPVPLTNDTGSFWFFDSSNLELMIKVLDGTRINGRFWVFYGSLSNVEYEITVTDNETGSVKTYTNLQGQVASVTDTEAF